MHDDLIKRIEAAEGPSRELFREVFDAVFPEPQQKHRGFFGSDNDPEYDRWLHAYCHFERLAGRKEWKRLTFWLCGITDRNALSLLAAALRARGGGHE